MAPARPEDFCVNSTVLNGPLKKLLTESNTGAAAFMIKGKLVWESYWNGATPASRFDTFSIGKAYAAVGIGLLHDDGKIGIDDPACKFLPEWSGDGRREITIRHLLTMTSGLKLDYKKFVEHPDPTSALLAWPLEYKPGTVWSYEQATAHALSVIIKRIAAKQPLALLQERVLRPIGAGETGWLTAANGDCLGWRSALTSVRDLARFGQLLLQKGAWEGKQLLSERFVAQATGHDPLIERCVIEKTQDDKRRRNWGWMMFVNDGGWWEGVGRNCFAPRGAHDNKCMVDPNRQFVFTRLSTPEGVDHSSYNNVGLDTGLLWRTVLSAFDN